MKFVSKSLGVSRRTFLAAAGGAVAMASMGPAYANERINMRTAGVQDPTLIFVHGFACSLDDWKAQVDGLSSKFKCVTLDLPGHGSSAPPTQPTIAALAAAVNDAKRQSNARRVILIGHSMGVKVIREAYRQSNDDVAGLVFVDSSTYVGDMDVLIKRMRDQVNSVGYPAFSQRLFSEMFVDGSDMQLRDMLVARAQKLDPKLAEELLVDSIRWELTGGEAAMKQIAVPTLVLQSTYFNSEYKRVPLKEGVTTPFMELVPKVVPNTEVKTVIGVGHFPMIEAATVVNQYIHDFASRVS
jgi:pimeloyl-ACP methyl ester carboxylesterase